MTTVDPLAYDGCEMKIVGTVQLDYLVLFEHAPGATADTLPNHPPTCVFP